MTKHVDAKRFVVKSLPWKLPVFEIQRPDLANPNQCCVREQVPALPFDTQVGEAPGALGKLRKNHVAKLA